MSSDIDLIYVYEHDGDTAGIEGGRGRISNHEYFARAVKAIYSLVGDTTEHGFVFRVDLAPAAQRQFRPGGHLAVGTGRICRCKAASGSALPGSRAAWWPPAAALAPLRCRPLRGVVLPFVFRRYLDYSVFDALRSLHRQIRDHAAKRSAGHPERANDVKLSRGGIREIEFTVQLLQVVRGASSPSCAAAHAGGPAAPGPAGPDAAGDRRRAWPAPTFFCAGGAPHPVPGRPANPCAAHARRRPGLDCQHHGLPLCCAFLHELDAHRELVAQEFDTLLGGNEKSSAAAAAAAAPRHRPATAQSWKTCWNNCPKTFARAWRMAQQPARG